MQYQEQLPEHSVNGVSFVTGSQLELAHSANTLPATEQRSREKDTRLLQAIAAVQKVEKHGTWTNNAVFIIGLLSAFVLTTLFVPDPVLRAKLVLGSFVLLPVLLIPIAQLNANCYTRAVQHLVKQQHVGSVGALLEVLENSIATPRSSHPAAIAARAGLVQLLPRLQPQDATLLTNHQREILLHQLQGSQAELILAILAALEHVGESTDIPVVQSLANGHERSGGDPRVQEAALRCWAQLLARKHQGEVSHSLLRPSRSTGETSPEILLRPAGSSADTEHPEQLLRASIPDQK